VHLELETLIARLLTVGARVSAFMVFAPFFGSMTIAPRIKAGLAIALTAIIYPLVGGSCPPSPAPADGRSPAVRSWWV
jgi:flagellar biosynthesis protein FliR